MLSAFKSAAMRCALTGTASLLASIGNNVNSRILGMAKSISHIANHSHASSQHLQTRRSSSSILSGIALSKSTVSPAGYVEQRREYKVKVRLRKRCKDCQFVWRNGRLYVECKTSPRHKQHHKDSFLLGYDNIANGYIPDKT